MSRIHEALKKAAEQRTPVVAETTEASILDVTPEIREQRQAVIVEETKPKAIKIQAQKPAIETKKS